MKIFHLILCGYANYTLNVTNLVFVTSSLLFSETDVFIANVTKSKPTYRLAACSNKVSNAIAVKRVHAIDARPTIQAWIAVAFIDIYKNKKCLTLLSV